MIIIMMNMKIKIGIKKTKEQQLEFKIEKLVMKLFSEDKKVNQTQKKNEFLYPSKITAFILNFLNFRKQQKNFTS